MASRYVWERYKTRNVIIETPESGTSGIAVDLPCQIKTYTSVKISGGIIVGNAGESTLTINNKNESVTVSSGLYAFIPRYGQSQPEKVRFPYGGTIRETGRYTSSDGWIEFSGDNLLSIGKEQGAFYDHISSSNESQYPRDNYSGSYWYVYQGQDSIDPVSVSIPETAKGQDGILASVTPSASIVYDGAVTYRYEYSTNGGSSWSLAGETTATSLKISIPAGAQTLKVRVRASDDMGFTSSDYVIAAATAVITWNQPPVISGSDSALGSFVNTPPSAYSYTVTDPNGDTVTVTEAIDGKVLRTYTPTLGQANSLQLTADQWLEVLNGSHTIKITANDGKGGTAVRTLTFTKNVTRIQFYLNPPLEAAEMPTKALESLIYALPPGAELTIEVCNNGNDAEPTWENVTQKVLAGDKIFLANAVKTAAEWGYGIRVTIDRKEAVGECWCSGGSGFFE